VPGDVEGLRPGEKAQLPEDQEAAKPLDASSIPSTADDLPLPRPAIYVWRPEGRDAVFLSLDLQRAVRDAARTDQEIRIWLVELRPVAELTDLARYRGIGLP
jgi:hypothetical protein